MVKTKCSWMTKRRSEKNKVAKQNYPYSDHLYRIFPVLLVINYTDKFINQNKNKVDLIFLKNKTTTTNNHKIQP